MTELDERPIRLSWSRIRVHEECPAKGQLLSEGKKSPISDIRGYFHGTVTDICQRRWLSQDNPQRGQMLAWVDEIFAQAEKDARESGDGVVKWKYAGDKADVLDLCRLAVTRLEPLLEKICLPYAWDPAVRFRVPLTIPGLDDEPRKIELVGEADLLVEYPPGMFTEGPAVVVWDLKATKDEGYWRKVKGQLVFYGIAVAAMRQGQFPYAAGLLQPLCEDQSPMFIFDPDDYAQMYSRIAKVAHDVWAGRILPKADNAGCKYCEVRGSCPKWPKGRGRVPLGLPAVQPS